MKKWNPKTKAYEEYTVPNDWFCTTYNHAFDMVINCAKCGKEILFGHAYTSRQIHTTYGVGYAICHDCYEIEFQEERSSE